MFWKKSRDIRVNGLLLRNLNSLLKSETKKEMDYENINEIIALSLTHVYDGESSKCSRVAYLLPCKNTDRKCLTLEKREN